MHIPNIDKKIVIIKIKIESKYCSLAKVEPHIVDEIMDGILAISLIIKKGKILTGNNPTK